MPGVRVDKRVALADTTNLLTGCIWFALPECECDQQAVTLHFTRCFCLVRKSDININCIAISFYPVDACSNKEMTK